MNKKRTADRGIPKRFNKKQYEMLVRCSSEKNMTEWNEWRKLFPGVTIELSHAKFSFANLDQANLSGANMFGIHLQNASLIAVNLKNVDISSADLNDAFIAGTECDGSNFERADLRGAKITFSHLDDADFSFSKMSDGTVIQNSTITKNTTFAGSNIDSAVFDPALKTAVKNNIRELEWKAWCASGRTYEKIIKNLTVKPFFWLSDYGRSTTRIILLFFIFALLFATIYFFWGLHDIFCAQSNGSSPGIIENLFCTRDNVQITKEIVTQKAYFWTTFIRAVYFSIVTMTTLGFGDMYADPFDYWGHIVLSLQVILGYIMLGAIITRFAVLFTTDGPEQKPGSMRVADGKYIKIENRR